MITRRFSPVSAALSLCVPLSGGFILAPVRAQGLPATSSARHPIAPLPDPATARVNQGFGNQALAPVSLAFQTGKGDQLATSDVNRITCVAPQGPIQWLGTQFGVKALDSEKKEIAHFTRRDGLPGDYVEAIVASADRVYCLVRVGDAPENLALCEIGPGFDRWSVLTTIQVRVRRVNENNGYRADSMIDDSWYAHWGESHLALTPDGVLIAPSAVDWHSDAVLYVWNRKQKALLPVGWDPLLRADSDVLGINQLWSEGRQAYLGTTEGLLSVDLGSLSAVPGAPGPAWQRYLPDKAIDAGAVVPGAPDTTFVLAAHARRSANPVPSTNGPLSSVAWELITLHAPSGVAEMATRRAAPKDTNNYGNAGVLAPQSVFLGVDGAVWVTSLFQSRYPGSYAPDPGGFSRYDPKNKVWTELGLSGLSAATQDRSDYQRQNTPAAAAIVPDGATLAAALDLRVGWQAFAAAPDPGFTRFPLLSPALWIAERFPLWNCPADEALPGGHLPPERYGEGSRETLANWTAQGQELIHQPGPGAASTTVERFRFAGGVHTAPPRVQSLVPPLPGSNDIIVQASSGIFTLTDRLSTGRTWRALDLAGQNRGTFDVWNHQIARIGPDRRLYWHQGFSPDLARYDATAAGFVDSGVAVPQNSQIMAGTAGGAWFRSGNQTMFVAFTGDSAAAAPENAPTALPAALAPAEGGSYLNFVGAAGDIIFFQSQIRQVANPRFSGYGNGSSPAVIGYDRSKHGWTQPLELDAQKNETVVVFEGPDGAAYAARDDEDAGVYRYDGRADKWKSVAPPIPPQRRTNFGGFGSVLTLISVSERDIYVADNKRLLHLDRRSAIWAAVNLPVPLQDRQMNQNYPVTRAVATGLAVYMGSDQGLWRFDRLRQIWQPVNYPISLDPVPPEIVAADEARMRLAQEASRPRGTGPNVDLHPQESIVPPPIHPAARLTMPTGVSLEIGAVDPRAVWGIARPQSGDGSFVYRFDRTLHRFTVYDERVGLPAGGNGVTLHSDGESIWVVRDEGAYRLNPRTGRFEQLFARRRQTSTGQPLPPTPGVVVGSVVSVAGDPAQPDSVYVLLQADPYGGGAHDVQSPILYRFHKSTDKLEPLPISPEVLSTFGKPDGNAPDQYPPNLSGVGGLLVSKGRVWVGTTFGICWVDTENGRWSRAKLPPGTPSVRARDIQSDPAGDILIASDRMKLLLHAAP